jgi:hypothetical protein
MMSVFTTTTKRKVIGLIMALSAVTALSATIVFTFAGEINHAIPAAAIFVNLILFVFSAVEHMNRKDAGAKTGDRCVACWEYNVHA